MCVCGFSVLEGIERKKGCRGVDKTFKRGFRRTRPARLVREGVNRTAEFLPALTGVSTVLWELPYDFNFPATWTFGNPKS